MSFRLLPELISYESWEGKLQAEFNEEIFNDRFHAGKYMAAKVRRILEQENWLKPGNTVVVALLSGGVPVGSEVARSLSCPLDIRACKKICCVENTDVAIGAVSSGGAVILDNEIIQMLRYRPQYVEAERARLLAATKSEEQRIIDKAGYERPDLSGKCVVVVDDGVATGKTATAALWSLRKENVAQLVMATPVIASDVSNRIANECDRLIALFTPRHLVSVSLYYHDYSAFSEDDVVKTLRQFNQSRLPQQAL